MRLTDPWFEAEFLGGIEPGDRGWSRQGANIDGAQGLFMCCPCRQGHAILVPFANPRNAQPVPADFGPWNRQKTERPRWTMAGTGLEDLTITPSLDIGEVTCWHGFITNGDVR